MDICVIGTGYVGLVTGAVLSNLGNRVICVDSNSAKINELSNGRVPIYEPGLGEMVEANLQSRKLTFSTNADLSIRASKVIFIAVGTPPCVDGNADVSDVEEVAAKIGRNLNGYKLVVDKSTVPVGTADAVAGIIESNRLSEATGFDVVSNPEFLREGSAVYDALHPDRIVIGAANDQAADMLAELYAPLDCPVVITDLRSAEMAKYASNAFLATKISFINAIAAICEAAGADVTEVARGMGFDRRIGHEFLNAGLGYGGSCFGKDTQCMMATARRLGCDFELLRAVMQINHNQPKRFVNRMRSELKDLHNKRIAVLGLAFKPNTDDLRDAKSLEVIMELLDEGAEVTAYDPVAMNNARVILPEIDYCATAYDAVAGADAAALVCEWDELVSLDMARVKELMNSPIIFDGRNAYSPEIMRQLGFTYFSIGRPTVRPSEVPSNRGPVCTKLA